MIVTCGQCGASFKVDPAKVKEGGSRVRCSNCQSVFTIYRPQNIAPAEVTAIPAAGAPRPPHSTATPTGFDLAKFLEDLESSTSPEFSRAVEKLEKQADATDFLLEEMEKEYKPSLAAGSDETGFVERRPSRYDNFEEDESFDFAGSFDAAQEDASATKPVKASPDGAELASGTRLSPAEPSFAPGQSASPAASKRRRGSWPDETGFDLELERDVAAEGALAEELAERKHLLDEPDEPDETWADQVSPMNETAPGPEEKTLLKLMQANAPPVENDDLGLGEDVISGRPSPDFKAGASGAGAPQPGLKKSLAPIWLIMGFGLLVLLGLGWFWFSLGEPATAVGERGAPTGAGPAAGAKPETETAVRLDLPPSITYDASTDKGGLNIHLKDSKPFLRKNKLAGQILIITGRAENNYPESRSFIQIKASLKDHAGNILAERLAYCGNILTEDELVNLPINEILARLAIKAGQNNANIDVPSGQSAPFMLVFDNVPESLDSYIVEALSSSTQGR